jgi:hypothetical protein
MSGSFASSALPSNYGTPNPIQENSTGALGSSAVADAFTLVSLEGILHDDSHYGFNIVGLNAASYPSCIGIAMAIDTTMPNAVHPAAPGDFILGTLITFEIRTNDGGLSVGTVCVEGGMPVPLDPTTGATLPAVGDSIQGGTVPGTVVKLARTEGSRTIVTAVSTVSMTATVLFL